MSKLEALKELALNKSARPLLHLQKHSPKILFVAGTVGVVGTVVLACRATLKMSEVLEDDLQIKAARIAGPAEHSENVDAYRKELHKLQVKQGVEIAKLYAPAVILGTASIAALTGSHVILDKRNGALMAAYAGLDRAYREYRDRVSREYGADVDRKFASNGYEVVVEEDVADGTTKLKSKVVPSKSGGSPYGALFDETNKNWSVEPGNNAMFIQARQNWANDKLKAQGHLFLNEAYDLVGLPRTRAGALVGWVYDPDSRTHKGDNYVSFGVFDGDLERAEAFIDGDEKNIWLDFNVDGMILDMI